MEKKTVKPAAAAKKPAAAAKTTAAKPATKTAAKKDCGCVVKLKSQAELNDGLKKAAKTIVKNVEGYTKADSAAKAKEVAAAFADKPAAAAKKPATKKVAAKPAAKSASKKATAKPAAKKPAAKK